MLQVLVGFDPTRHRELHFSGDAVVPLLDLDLDVVSGGVHFDGITRHVPCGPGLGATISECDACRDDDMVVEDD